jgi:hypothetical protein
MIGKRKERHGKEERSKSAEKSDFVGNKGDKIRRSLKWVFTIRGGESNWGSIWITKFVDEDDNVFMLKGPYPPFKDDKENFHDCVFTIKYYNEFKGEKQTIITRMKDLTPKEETETSPKENNTNTEDYDSEMEARAAANESFYPRLT